MTRLIVACCLAAPLLGCVHDPESKTASSNPDVQVDLLFTHDGCRVYRFHDGYYHYYVRCDGPPGQPAQPAASTASCLGKGCHDDDSIPTVLSVAH